ncbi:hypothetical protein AGOR_G00182520 [Albula goreensis]|uniref:Selenoprotein H n=1 Tax=Albula goreensis TaxID=1534307 RepID=A0A8T3D030_9TELE|nr:hypothetical protein AGOR_G00182520 [Albula goreensis]
MASCSKSARGRKRKAEPGEEEAPALENKKEKGAEEEEDEKDEGQRAIRGALQEAHPDLKVQLNPQKPRRNSFEITLLGGEKEVSLWSGIKKGPPRKLKFPEPTVVLSALEEALKSQ